VQDGKERATLTEDVGCVRSLAFSPDGDWLAYAGSDLTIRVWHVSAGKQTLLVGRCPLKA
jgi:WD40 repeat protein